MRIIDAYRSKTITRNQYEELLALGYSSTDSYSTSYIPAIPTNPWIEILDWDTDGIGPKNIVVENLDVSYDLECKVEIYVDDILSRTDSATFSTVWTSYINEPCTDIVVSVRSAQYGQSASYDFAYTNEY